MKKIMAITVVLVLLLGLGACKEIGRLSQKILPIAPGYNGLGAIKDGHLIMFIMLERQGFFWFNDFDPVTSGDLTWVARDDGTYWYCAGMFYPQTWSEEDGLAGVTVLGTQEEITKGEFKRAVKPMAVFLLENGVDTVTAMKPIADSLGLVSMSGEPEQAI